MLRIAIKHNRQALAALKKRVEKINAERPYVKVGLLGSGKARPDGLSNAEIGIVHEFGAPEANIPARPWLRPPIEAKRAEYEKQISDGLDAALRGTGNLDRALGLVGQQAAAAVKGYVTQGPPIPPPNSEKTQKRKESKRRKGSKGEVRTLVDTGRMVGGVTYKVEKGGKP